MLNASSPARVSDSVDVVLKSPPPRDHQRGLPNESARNDYSGDYFEVGITNSAPFSMLSGQRCMIDF
jgi:hypothetical protein